jgi:uncharacterized protein YjbI with pentapeptide repeats
LGDDPGVTARSNQPDQPPPRPLSNWTIAAGALVVLAAAAVVSFLLLRRYGGQTAQVQLDAIRTAGTLVVGTGGAVALLLTARRQRYTELSLLQTDRDATERRITELYTKAADQLGNDKAPVRLAGLHALERLAQNTPEQRQTIVDVICAYLRMPYTPPQPSSSAIRRPYRSTGSKRRRRTRALTDRPPSATPTSQGSRQENAQQEQQVRLTAQNILSRNLRLSRDQLVGVDEHSRRWWHRTPPPPIPNWPGIHLNLTGSALAQFSLQQCQLYHADLRNAEFTDAADLRNAEFTDGANFVDARFTGGAHFAGARFTGGAYFADAWFTGGADFAGARFTGGANFVDARFTGGANFRGAQFTGGAEFRGAQFTDAADVRGIRFTGEPTFEGARVASEAGNFWPPGWTTRPANRDNGEDPAFLYLTKVEKPSAL